jgi:hypothetical protein
MTLSRQICQPIAAAFTRWGGCVAAILVGLTGPVQAQQRTEPIEMTELKAAVDVLRKQLADSESKVIALEKASSERATSLAEANRVAEELRGQYEELLLRMASFGVDLVKPDPKSLEQRLLSAVRDRDQAERAKQELSAQLVKLSEAAAGYVRSAPSSDAAMQAAMERELEAADRVLGLSMPGSESGSKTKVRPVSEGKVVSIDAQIGLVVVNVGRESGVRVGMPLNLKRDQQAIGTALVVDVRDAIAGALLQKLTTAGDVKVGDRIETRPDAL